MELTKKISLFGRTRALEGEIDDFLDKLSQCSLLYKIAIKVYLTEGYTEEFEQKLQDVNKMSTTTTPHPAPPPPALPSPPPSPPSVP